MLIFRRPPDFVHDRFRSQLGGDWTNTEQSFALPWKECCSSESSGQIHKRQPSSLRSMGPLLRVPRGRCPLPDEGNRILFGASLCVSLQISPSDTKRELQCCY